MRKAVLSLMVCFLVMIALVPPALAADVKGGSRVIVAAGEVVDDDVIASGVSVEIRGTVKGDVIAFAQSVAVDGTVEGNLVVFAAATDVAGRVGGSIYAASEDVRITGTVGGSAVIFGANQTIGPGAAIGRNWVAFGSRAESRGRIGRGVRAFAGSLLLGGSVAGDVNAWTEGLTLAEGAEIAGGVTYRSHVEAVVEPGARTGEITWIPETYGPDFDRGPLRAVRQGIRFTGFLLAGLILLALFPRLRLRYHQAVATKPWQTPIAGLVVLLVVPLASVLVMMTMVGLPLGLIALATYPVAIYAGQVLLSYSVGRLVADRWRWLAGQHWAVIFFAGSLVTTLLIRVPFLGFALGFAAVLYGLGGLFFACLPEGREAA